MCVENRREKIVARDAREELLTVSVVQFMKIKMIKASRAECSPGIWTVALFDHLFFT